MSLFTKIRNNHTHQSHNRPLIVDLDETFLKIDTLFEMFFHIFFRNPMVILFVFKNLDKPHLIKAHLLSHYSPSFALWPVRTEILQFLKEQFAKNREIYLVTGAHQKIADYYCKKYLIFKDAFGSNHEINLVGKNKAQFLVNKFGEFSFDYIGDSQKDIDIWNVSHTAYLVPVHFGVLSKFKKTKAKFHEVIKLNTQPLKSLKKLIRPQQWVKNGLLFIPLILAHQFNFDSILVAVLGFIGFSFLASSVYVLNDFVDVISDRQHPTKKFRPIASGDINFFGVLILLLISFMTQVILTQIIGLSYLPMMIVYFILNLIYSFYSKKIPIYDVFFLTSFYVIRILQGSFLTQVELSPWLLIFSGFFFLSLGILKRYSDLLFINQDSKTAGKGLDGRGYQYLDQHVLFGFGLVSGFTSILVFALYIYLSPQVQNLYKNKIYLWGVLVSLLLWMMRLWFKGSRGEVQDDPVKFALKDIESVVLGVFVILFIGLSL